MRYVRIFGAKSLWTQNTIGLKAWFSLDASLSNKRKQKYKRRRACNDFQTQSEVVFFWNVFRFGCYAGYAYACAYFYVDTYVAHFAACFFLIFCLDPCAYACISWKPGFIFQIFNNIYYPVWFFMLSIATFKDVPKCSATPSTNHDHHIHMPTLHYPWDLRVMYFHCIWSVPIHDQSFGMIQLASVKTRLLVRLLYGNIFWYKITHSHQILKVLVTKKNCFKTLLYSLF